MNTITTSLNQAWKLVSADMDVEAVAEYVDLLSRAIERNSRSTVMRSADELSAFILQALDLRRIASSIPQDKPISGDDIEAIESKLQALSITFIYKLNDTAFRPLFENWVDWAIKGSDVVDDEYSNEAKAARETSLFRFVNHFFATLKSIVTSYASYVLQPANEILRSTAESIDIVISDDRVALYKSTLQLLTTALSHDADGFFASPSHFSPLATLLISQLTLSAAKARPLRETTASLAIPALVALATATMDTPAHHHAINHGLCQLRHHSSAAVRLAAIRAQLALTESEEVGEEWVNNVVVGTSTEGVGGSGETMVYVNESLEDDDEQVENEVRRWVRLVREMVGEDVFEM
jgi:U3 small nucleolar RNA-associated protein 10